MSDASDLDQIMAIMATAFDPIWGEAWNRRQVQDAIILPNTYFILSKAGTNKNAAGFLITRQAPGEEELLLIAVHPEYRRRGIGKDLLQQLVSDAANRGTTQIYLEMRENNPAASLYKNFGFEPIGRRLKYYLLQDGQRMDAITYGLSI